METTIHQLYSVYNFHLQQLHLECSCNMERDKRLEVLGMLRAGSSPTVIANELGVSRTTVYAVKDKMEKGDGVERKSGSGRPQKIDHEKVRDAVRAAPTTSMRQHAKSLGVCKDTVRRSVKEDGGKSLVMLAKPLLTPAIKENHLQRCKGLINDLKSSHPNRVIIFSDEKTWTVDPVRNRKNDRFIAFGKVDLSKRTVTTTKHPASIMSLGFVASNGQAMPLVWFPTGFRLTASAYIEILESKLIPWVKTTFPHGNVVLQQDGAPAHTAKLTQEFLSSNATILGFWSKEKWPPYSPDANPLDFGFWPHIQAKSCRVRHPNTTALQKAVDENWTAMKPEFIRSVCKAFRKRLVAIVEAEGGYIE